MYVPPGNHQLWKFASTDPTPTSPISFCSRPANPPFGRQLHCYTDGKISRVGNQKDYQRGRNLHVGHSMDRLPSPLLMTKQRRTRTPTFSLRIAYSKLFPPREIISREDFRFRVKLVPGGIPPRISVLRRGILCYHMWRPIFALLLAKVY